VVTGGEGPVTTVTAERRAELLANLDAVRDRIGRACAAAGRQPTEITLVAVTKFFPASDAAVLAEAGVLDLGENRDQEAAAKAIEVAALTDAAVRWHFLGRLQTNKARSVARYASLVHSVDRVELADALAAGALRAGRAPLAVLVQLSLDEDPARGGSAAEQLLELADHVDGSDGLRLAGLMAIAPLRAEPDQAFAELARVGELLRGRHPVARIVSAGMSADLEQAVAHGATHLRIGTALLGRRAATFR
jgi:hypothetical protein